MESSNYDIFVKAAKDVLMSADNIERNKEFAAEAGMPIEEYVDKVAKELAEAYLAANKKFGR